MEDLRSCRRTFGLDGLMTDEDISLVEIRIENALLAKDNSVTCWSKMYWDNVVSYLMRQANRIN